MSDSLRLSVPDLADADAAAGFWSVAAAAADVDGDDPFNEQARLDVAAGRRTPVVATVWSEDRHARPIGAAIVGRGELDLVVDPLFRGKGFGGVALAGLLPTAQGELTAWSHGAHPAAAALARRHGFATSRRLERLVLDPLVVPEGPRDGDSGRDGAADGITIRAFSGSDAEADAWVAVNARAFASHPEQGRVDRAAFDERRGEAWFRDDDLVVAVDADGRLVGFDWVKAEAGSTTGEIYVLGVDPDTAGRGLGRRLLAAGLARLAERGMRRVDLYVEGDNVPALGLYRRTGFVADHLDVQYRRPATS